MGAIFKIYVSATCIISVNLIKGSYSAPWSLLDTTLSQSFLVVESGHFSGDFPVGFQFLASQRSVINPSKASPTRDDILTSHDQSHTPILVSPS